MLGEATPRDVPMLAFGPVPSRRLGRSLGVNNIPPKHWSYSCVYCQVGPTPGLELERGRQADLDDLVRDGRVVRLEYGGETFYLRRWGLDRHRR